VPIDLTTFSTGLRAWSLVKWIAEKAAKYSQRPVLTLHCDSRPRCAVQSPVRLTPPRWPEIDAVSKALSNYYRLQVTNTGRSLARGVRVQLTDIWYVERQIWKRLRSWQPADLPWAGRVGTPAVDLHPQQDDLCDLGFVRTNALQNNVPLPQGVRVLPKNEPAARQQALFMLAPETQLLAHPNAFDQGHYVLAVRVYVENASSVSAYIDLAFPGRFAALDDARQPGPLGGVEISLRDSPPELYAVDDHPINAREPRYAPPHPATAPELKTQPSPESALSTFQQALHAVDALMEPLKVDVQIRPNVGAGSTPGAFISVTNREPETIRGARCILLNVLSWNEGVRRFVETTDAHQNGLFPEMETGGANLFCGQPKDLGFIRAENERLDIQGTNQEHCRMTTPGIRLLVVRVEAANGRTCDATVCFEWRGQHAIPESVGRPDVGESLM
jgi:hypothetical protein